MKSQGNAAKMATVPVCAFSFAEYRATYTPKRRSRGSATLPQGNIPQRWAIFREAKRRLEHGVPVSVLVEDVTRKLRMMRGGVR